ncbi:glycosyltransferase family 4 protein [Cupriavidus alkaliphilus]|uniref:Glycosyltransferase involved in cell wall biosynthesis n=1 Tax=Cupriavidus alkaliphilus TaxID=942866 RepID=A0A7W4V723_9BURK|nr:glycosyltransferase family 4 protein [Cupriavidus alkaliphilus]MBB3006213.1 glycosyltransferase involved in cell wall biosynthesis [Cupriavidus alkaliphilus]SCB16507.1 Glycosyltransferase involved in cell wall bisynthesis [Cupriavidus alkaliphilus]
MQKQASISTKYCDLLIIDEMLPCNFSTFRLLEYSHYLRHFKSSILLTTEGWHGGYSNLGFSSQLSESNLPAEAKSRIFKFDELRNIVPKLAYITFLNNADQLLPYLEERAVPFVLQLYPGGGFDLHTDIADARLRRVVNSPLCRKVIVSQNVSHTYALDITKAPLEKFEFIYGGVYETHNGFDFHRDKKFYGRNKDTLDICFVAHRYGNDVRKKGYDQFIAIGKALAPSFPDLQLHVVGDYTPDQIPLDGITDRIIFHGKQPNSFFKEFYPSMDIILSVNRPANEGGSGAFDGFPTGACMEAGFSGVLNCISDPLGMNVAFTDDVDIILLDYETQKSAQKISKLLRDLDKLYELAYRNWEKYLEVFDKNQQLWKRCQLITNELLAEKQLIVRPPSRRSDMDMSLFSELTEKLRQAAGNHLDAERRHDNLLAEYRKLASGFESVVEENKKLAALLLAQAEAVAPPPPFPMQAHGRAEVMTLRALRSTPLRRARAIFNRIASHFRQTVN